MTGPCNSCGLDEVRWYDGRGGKFQKHDGGRASCRFPCKKCDHLDCAEARGILPLARAVALHGVDVT